MPEPLTLEQALARVETLTQVCRVFDLTAFAVLDGCHAAARYQLSIWDALIWAVAKLNGVPYIVTKDAEHDRVVGGIHYLNPFADSFDLDVLAV